MVSLSRNEHTERVEIKFPNRIYLAIDIWFLREGVFTLIQRNSLYVFPKQFDSGGLPFLWNATFILRHPCSCLIIVIPLLYFLTTFTKVIF